MLLPTAEQSFVVRQEIETRALSTPLARALPDSCETPGPLEHELNSASAALTTTTRVRIALDATVTSPA